LKPDALTEVTLPGPAADGRLRRPGLWCAHKNCRRRPTTGTKCPGRTISIGVN